MRYERRHSGINDRRKLCEISRRQESMPATEDADSSRDESARLREEVVKSREGSVSLREDANLAREEDVHVREDAARGRETTALLREETATSREQEMHDERVWSAAQQEDRHVKLMQANEQLVIAAIQLQTATDELEKSKAEMTYLAHHDFLTDLLNRAQIADRISQAIAFAKRHKAKLAVLFLDLDRFKIVNDSLGHAVGDQLLQSVAQRLKSAIRSTDTVARQGGDEFVLLLSEVTQEQALVPKIKKIHEIVTAPYSIAGNTLHIGVTIGISIFPEDGEDGETLMRNADAAMYYAKENGRNRFQFFRQEMRARDLERDVEINLHEALDKRQFELYYQAQLNLACGTITGAEALIRWHHPSRGLVLPARFIPVAEECGAIVPIGHWVLREACRQAQSWLDAGLTLDVIAVNISAREFEHDGFLENVRSVLQETGLAPSRLELELTETVLMKRIERTAATLHALRLMGVRISIDDFGTGYSSLSYLKRFPVDTMKIDQSFVRDISINDDNILVNAIICLGKSLKHQVIAEGVETPQQLAFLRENNCVFAQGFYLHVPMIAREFAVFLKQGIPENILH